jgi:uncharacterized integral membrane protein
MKFIKFIIFALLLAVLIAFATQNDSSFVSISFFGLESASMPLYAILFIVAGLMVILMSFVGLVERLRLKNQVRKLNKQVKELSGELELYKGAPAKTDTPVQAAPAIPAPAEDAPTVKKRRRFSFKKETETEAIPALPETADTAETSEVDTDATEQ